MKLRNMIVKRSNSKEMQLKTVMEWPTYSSLNFCCHLLFIVKGIVIIIKDLDKVD